VGDGSRPRRVGLLGGGVIGGGWAARFLLNGIDVRLYDPDPGAQRRVEEMVANARRAYARLTLSPLPAEGTLSYVDSLEEAVTDVALVQESAPERIEIKRQLLGAASRAADPGTLFCSSTSGLRPSLLGLEMEAPERLVVAHPFNPVYLLPLVELCGGERTAPETVERAAAVYTAVGMHPVTVRTEIDGFIADRLLEALWREALWLVHDGIATVEEVDDAIRYGAGLRWAVMGTFLTYRMAGGEGGFRHFIEQFGPALEAPWTKLVDVPELTPTFVDTLSEQSDAQAGGRSVAELERDRDDCLVAILQALRSQETGAGETLAIWERGLMGPAGPKTDEAPLRLLTRVVPAEFIDYNGHVQESRYLQLFSEATDTLLRVIGVDTAYLARGHSYFTVETHISHVGQLVAGDQAQVTTQLLGFDDKRLHVFHVMTGEGSPDPVATAEQMLVHVDSAAGRSAPAPEAIRSRLAGLADAHAALPVPPGAGRGIALEHRSSKSR
jgi:carnitine 3-dehydrogenase